MKLPPHNIEAEQAVIGACLLEPGPSVPLIVSRAIKEKMYDLRHGSVLAAIEYLFDKGAPVDLITMQDRLREMDMLEKIGGVNFLIACQDVIPSAAGITYYLDIIEELYYRRKVIQKCSVLINNAYSLEGKFEEFADTIETEIFSLRNKLTRETSRKESIMRVLLAMENQIFNKTKKGLMTGFRDLDKMLNGLQNSRFYVLAGRPGVGKSSLELTMLDNITTGQGITCGLFSMEMPMDEVNERNLAIQANVNMRHLCEEDMDALAKAALKLHNSPLIITDRTDLNINQIRAEARRMVSQEGAKLICVDYLQLVSGVRSHEKRSSEVGEVTRGLKKMAMELEVPVIGLSAMNRKVDGDKRRPRMSDLKESGDIEQDADAVLLLYEVENDGGSNDDTTVGVVIDKNRGGSTGEIKLTFKKRFTRYENYQGAF